VQDASLIAMTRIGDLRDPSAARAWLVTIVANACRGRFRRPTALRAATADESFDPVAPDDVERAIDQLALRDWVWTALEGLSEPLRLVVILRYFTSVSSYEAIADVCGMPVGTVRSRLNAAKAKLAEQLLETAAQPHLHPGGPASRAAQIGEAMFNFTRYGDRRSLSEAFTDDLEFVMFDRIERRGLDNYAAALTHDMDDGVTVRPIRVVSSSDITVFETWLDSPPDNPLHCPPAMTLVYHHPDGPARRVMSHYAPRDPVG
jgi:RNA polymerase sigma-70 factor (ECF subfamily)